VVNVAATRRALLTAALLTAAEATTVPAWGAGTTTLRIQHTSLQFSDTRLAHRHDARAIFHHARAVGNVLVSGTESGRHNSLWHAIPAAAADHGFALHLHPTGDWVAVDRHWGAISHRGYVAVLAAHPGGKHGPRGIVWARVRPHSPHLGTVSYGAGHWLAPHLAGHQIGNRHMARAVGHWARHQGEGPSLVFYAADTNQDDAHLRPFGSQPLRTCWDELGHHPPTRTSHTIDVVASLDWDQRVSCLWASSLGDGRMWLATDHSLIEAGVQGQAPCLGKIASV
jgi:hypothetical protein